MEPEEAGGTYFDRALLVTCVDGLGRFVKQDGAQVYVKDVDTLGAASALAMPSVDGRRDKHNLPTSMNQHTLNLASLWLASRGRTIMYPFVRLGSVMGDSHGRQSRALQQAVAGCNLSHLAANAHVCHPLKAHHPTLMLCRVPARH